MTRRSMVAACLLLWGTALAAAGGGRGRRGGCADRQSGCGDRPAGVASCNWCTLAEQRCDFGLSAERVEAMLAQCRESGLSAAEAKSLLAPVLEANRESLPAECVFIKIKEGLAKKVEVGRIVAVARARLDCLRRARRLLASVSPGHGAVGPPHLLTQTCLLLESGLSETALKDLFARHGGRRYGRLLHVLEAGETLQLAGLAPRNTLRLMKDCLERGLNRPEIIRVVDYVLRERRKGRDFEVIHAELWPRRSRSTGAHRRHGFRGGRKND